MKNYPIAQQIKYLRLKTDIEALILELQDKSQQSQNNFVAQNEDRVLSRDIYWNAA